ncbi:MAG: HTTM domain-containing protein [Pseudomonadota bacterium]
MDAALRMTELLLALAFLQHSAEHLVGPRVEKALFGLRGVLCLLLLAGVQTAAVLLGLCLLHLVILHRFQGPYNGGSDRMGGLVLACLSLAHWLPGALWQEVAFAYLGVQLTLSYVVSGLVKLRNPDWRRGTALSDVFAFSAYPVSEDLRGLASRGRLMWAGSWAVILFEALFPLALIFPLSLAVALLIGALFHLTNACLFGLNRFFWIWLAAYPSLIWLQARLIL